MHLSQVSFRWFFLLVGLANVLGQAMLLMTFKFEVDKDDEALLLICEMEEGPRNAVGARGSQWE